jgi:hypothetical protein
MTATEGSSMRSIFSVPAVIGFALAALAAAAPAFALDLRVGTGAGCTHASLQAALDSLQSSLGTHTVRINKGAYPVPDGMRYVPTVNQSGVFLEGGYDSCTAPAPSGDVTLDADRAVFNAPAAHSAPCSICACSAASAPSRSAASC